ncbi:MAG TPA: hypothetical protein VHC63_14880 [Acidimicrobiales bacterium]|nr:hypothetical protein [Acidimicrobiales bacterium]
MPRLQTPVAVLLFAALAGGACGGGSKATPLEAVQAAANKTQSARTAAMTVTIAGGQGALSNTSFDGAFDFDHHLGSIEVDASKLGIPGGTGTIEAIMDVGDSFVEYMKIPQMAQETGKHWLKLDVGAAMKSVCPDIDFTALLKNQSGDPTSGLRILDAADKVTAAGNESVRGTNTTHYQVEVNLNKVADNASADAKKTIQQLASFYANPVQNVDVWLDSDGRMRRFKQTVDTANLKLPPCLSSAQAAATNPFKGTLSITQEMYDFGKTVDVAVPAASDVADLQDLLRQAG